jgi:hypothetical protein
VVRLAGVGRPRAVRLDGRAWPSRGWSYDSRTRTLTVSTPPEPTDRAVTVTAG